MPKADDRPQETSGVPVAELEERLSLFTRVLEQSPVSIAVLDAQGTVQYANPKLLSVYNIPADRVVGKNWRSVVSSSSTLREVQPEITAAVVKQGIPWTGQFSDVDSTGERIWRQATVIPVKDREGKVSHAVYVSEDITKRKEAEMALEESEKRLELALDATREGVFDWNLQTGKVFCSPRCFLMLDYDPAELVLSAGTWKSLIHPEDSAHTVSVLEEYHRGTRDAHEIECRIRTKSGGWRWISSRGRLVERDSEGKPARLIGTHTDITERKDAEKALEESEAGFRALAEKAGDGIAVVSANVHPLFINRRVSEMTGYTLDELRDPRTLAEALTREELGTIQKNLLKRLEGTGAPPLYRVNLTRKDGTRIPIELTATLITWRGTPASLAIVRDISERMRAEAALREVNARLRAVMESPRDIIIFSLDRNYRYTSFNENHKREMRSVYGVEIGHGMSMLDAVTGGEMRAGLQQKADRVLAGESFSEVQEHPDLGIFYERTWSPIRNEEQKVTGISCFVQDVTERRRAEEALRKSEDRYRMLIANIPYVTWISKRQGTTSFISSNIKDVCGFTPEEIYESESALCFGRIHPDDREGAQKAWERLFADNEPFDIEYRVRRRDGEWILLSDRALGTYEEGGSRYGYGIFSDITERRRMEEQLRQSEKMEAIGQLAGGVAHDFNNQLTSILGYAELLREKVGKDPKLTRYADSILISVKRAADLTSQLLAFSRKGKFLSVTVDLHRIIFEIANMLSHSIDKRIAIRQALRANPPTTLGDPSQLQNAVLNLALNARDAMPQGGELTFATDVVDLDEEYCRKTPYETTAGRYVEVSVADTGTGIAKEARPHIFEPFFTTKDQGRGTGMGLAAVYGTVKNHKGAIDVCSEPGRGTTFRVYLPLAEARARVETNAAPATPPARRSAHVLLVEDEESVRRVAAEMLKGLGYRVTACRDGAEAVGFYEKSWQTVDLVILDMVMPVKSGRDAFVEMHRINPNILALLASGYSLDSEAQLIIDEGVKGFIHKPFRKGDLAQKIAELLRRQKKRS